MKLLAIDPYDCGCTECVIGEYKPLRYATDDDIADLLSGRLRDNTYRGSLEVSVTYRSGQDRDSRMTLTVDTVTVTYAYPEGGRESTWEPDPYRAGLIK